MSQPYASATQQTERSAAMPFATKAQRTAARARLKAHGDPCYICGQPIDYSLKTPDPMSFEAEHVIATKHGGTDGKDNIRAAHRACNRAKSDKPFAPVVRRSTSLKMN